MKTAVKIRPMLWPRIGAGILALFLFFCSCFTFFIMNREVIYEGITINGILVGGKSQQQAVEDLEAVMEPVFTKERLTVVYGGDSWDISLKGIGGYFDYYHAVKQAYSIGRRGNAVKRLGEIYRAREEGVDVPLRFSYNTLALRAFLEAIDREIANPAVNATISRKGQIFVVTPEVKGAGVDIDLALKQIGSKLEKKDWSRKQLPVKVKIPEITADMLNPISTRWGIFHTAFDTGNKGRSENIRIASSSIEGTLLKPGEIFSFNQVTGSRLSENGYMEAPVIFKGELTQGVGGGVCQVSSTLYNAVLYSNLEIVERHPHSLPSAYISKGRDATVAGDILDLKFRNNTDGYVYIACWTEGGRLCAAVFGREREENYDIKIRTETVQVIRADTEIIMDATLKEGEEIVEKEARDGYRVKTYRQVFKGDKLEKEELLSFDFYKPEKGVIRKGISPAIGSGIDEGQNIVRY